MMTLLPLANVTASVQALHDEDLEIQMVDAGRLLRMCAEPFRSDTLVTAMWRHYEGGLLAYFLNVCKELQRRGVGRGVDWAIRQGWFIAESAGWDLRPLMPRWFGYRPVHLSHASYLIRERPSYYAQHWPDVPLDMPVLWPKNVNGHFDFTIAVSADDREAVLRGELVLNLAPTGPLGKVML